MVKLRANLLYYQILYRMLNSKPGAQLTHTRTHIGFFPSPLPHPPTPFPSLPSHPQDTIRDTNFHSQKQTTKSFLIIFWEVEMLMFGVVWSWGLGGEGGGRQRGRERGSGCGVELGFKVLQWAAMFVEYIDLLTEEPKIFRFFLTEEIRFRAKSARFFNFPDFLQNIFKNFPGFSVMRLSRTFLWSVNFL